VLDKDAYVFRETLRNGTPITLRTVRVDDGPRILRAFKSLDCETVYTRFFGYKADVSDAELERITGADLDRDVVLLVTIGAGDDEVVIGGANYFTVAADPSARSAEIAFTVEEYHQGLGVARLLMRHIIHIARQNSLTHLVADVLVQNPPMLAVFKRSGLPMTQREGNVPHVTLSLRPNALTIHHRGPVSGGTLMIGTATTVEDTLGPLILATVRPWSWAFPSIVTLLCCPPISVAIMWNARCGRSTFPITFVIVFISSHAIIPTKVSPGSSTIDQSRAGIRPSLVNGGHKRFPPAFVPRLDGVMHRRSGHPKPPTF
jgi:RimJ/RimL family protein N-acetyltransferase